MMFTLRTTMACLWSARQTDQLNPSEGSVKGLNALGGISTPADFSPGMFRSSTLRKLDSSIQSRPTWV